MDPKLIGEAFPFPVESREFSFDTVGLSVLYRYLVFDLSSISFAEKKNGSRWFALPVLHYFAAQNDTLRDCVSKELTTLYCCQENRISS
jgi:hypothetical protein